jgi:two-component system, sensor histidine kinase and response regulator
LKKTIFFIYIILTIMLFSSESKNILILNSYSYDFPLTEKIMIGIIDSFNESGVDVNFQVEYLDSRKMLNKEYYDKMADIYKYKFQHMKFDLIICSDNDALEFLVEHRKEIFTDIPIVFCGINGYKKQMIKGEQNITGITEELGIEDTIKELIKIHQNVKNIIILNDRTNSGIIFRKLIEEEKLEEKFGKNIIYIDDFNIGIEEIPLKIKELSKDSILFFTFFTIDKDRKKISNEETIKRIYKASNIPIYGVYEAFLGNGIIGGKLVSRYTQGKGAGKIAIEILNGKNAEDIPITVLRPDKFKFDYEKLKQAKINIKDIPKESILINKNLTFYEKNKNMVIFIIALFILLLIIIALLIGNNLKTQKINKIIRESKEKAESNINFVRNVINSAPSMYSVKDKQGKIILVNRAFAEFYKMDIENLEGKFLIEVFLEKNMDISIAKKINEKELEVISEEKKLLGLEEKITIDENKQRWIYSNIVPLKIDEKIYSLRVSLDITNKKNAEIEIENSKERAVKASIAKGHFLATMSHEIRTPLNGIITMLEILNGKEKELKLKEIKREIEIIDISAQRLLGVIDSVLDISKIEYGEIEFENSDFNIREDIKKSILIFKEKIKQKSLDVLYYVEDKIPEIIRGDSVKYQQIITNIIGNAVKFTNKGYIIIQANLLSKEGDNVTIRLSIKDTGIGISKEAQENIFKKFLQVEKYSEKNRTGVGLGLAISKELTERMGGSISVESTKGRGTIFNIDIKFKVVKDYEKIRVRDKEIILFSDNLEYTNIYIKIIRNIEGLNFITAENKEELDAILGSNIEYINKYFLIDIIEESKEVEELIKKTVEKSKEKPVIILQNSTKANKENFVDRIEVEDKLRLIFGSVEEDKIVNAIESKEIKIALDRVMVVEDDEINKEAIIYLLNKIGIKNIDIASDGNEAINKYIINRDKFILMDLQLPEKNGFEVLKEIRDYEKNNKIKNSTIIAVTANATEGYREKCLMAGFDEYISKPLSSEKLLKIVAKFLNYEALNLEKLSDEYSENKVILKHLLNSVIKNLPLLIKEIETGIVNKDIEQIEKSAHKLKGAVGNIKAEKLYELADKMEKTAKQNNIDKTILIFEEINYEVYNLKECIFKNFRKN